MYQSLSLEISSNISFFVEDRDGGDGTREGVSIERKFKTQIEKWNIYTHT